jgi:hypothetical protein
MAHWTRESVEELLQAKMKETVARLKVKGHKAGIDDLASNLAPLVIALMSDSRRREVSRILKDESGPAVPPHWLVTKLKARHQELKVMAQALWKFAEKR